MDHASHLAIRRRRRLQPGVRVAAAALGLVLVGGVASSAQESPPSDAIASEAPLYSVVIEQADIPAGPAVVGLGRFEFAPDASVTSPVGSQPPSVAVESILEGAYGVTSEGRTEVLRAPLPDADAATAAVETISDGSLITLGPGDVVVYLDNAEAASHQENLGQARVVGIAAGIFSTQQATVEWSVEGDYVFEFLDFATPDAWAQVPTGDVRLTLLRDPDGSGAEPVPGSLLLAGDVDGLGSVLLLVEPAT